MQKLARIVVALGIVGTVGGVELYRIYAADDCCKPGAACCKPGAACCARHAQPQAAR